MMLRNYASMTNLEYHEKQLNYNSTSLLASIAEQFPGEQHSDLNDPRFAQFLESNPYNPKILGDLAHSLGVDEKFLSPELWKDLSNGWCPVSDSVAIVQPGTGHTQGKNGSVQEDVHPDQSRR